MSHKNKWQFKCPNEGYDKKFNTKIRLTQHQLVYQKNKSYRCNYCWYETNYARILNDHIKIRHTRQDLVKYTWSGCEKKFTEKNLKNRMKYMHKDVGKYKCKFEGCFYATGWIEHLKCHVKQFMLKSSKAIDLVVIYVVICWLSILKHLWKSY
mgnify:CR=1 FL=1